MLFECHITLDLKDAVKGQELADERGWKTSQIERDPTLGEKSYFYLTKHSRRLFNIYDDMRGMSLALYQRYNVSTVREKIELIVHDTKVTD